MSGPLTCGLSVAWYDYGLAGSGYLRLKFVVLVIALLAAFPLSLLLRSSHGFTRMFWTAFGMLPFFAAALPMFDVALITWAGDWIGFVYSLEITIVDIFALAALLSFAPGGGSIPAWCKLPLLLYVGAAALSMLQATQPLAAAFGVWQFARMFLIMMVVARLCLEPKRAIDILNGMALGMGAHLIAVLYQRYGLHLPQAHGLFIHQNTLGMAAHLVLFPHLALLLYGYTGARKQLLTILGTILVVLFTASRAAVGFSAVGMALLYSVLALAGLTGRKMLFVSLAVMGLVAVAPVAMSSFDQRFEASPLTEDQYDERAAFNRAATFIAEDYPWGIGVNHYVQIARDYGYSERAGVWPSEGNRNNIVHNAYLLAAAETGYLGLIAFCLMLAVPLVTAFHTGWRFRATGEGNLLLGFGVALLVVYVHSFYEWVIFAKEIQYLLFMTMGMIFGITLRLNAMARHVALQTQPMAAAGSRVPQQGAW